MNKLLCILLIVAGIILTVYGANNSGSMSSGFSRILSGIPDNRALWLLISGIAALAVGIAGLFRGFDTR